MEYFHEYGGIPYVILDNILKKTGILLEKFMGIFIAITKGLGIINQILVRIRL